MSKETIFRDTELGDIDVEEGKTDLEDLARRIADVDPERPSQEDEM